MRNKALGILLAMAVCLVLPQEAKANENGNWFLFGKNSPLMKSERGQGHARQVVGASSRAARQDVLRSHRNLPASYRVPRQSERPVKRAQSARPAVPEKFNRQEVAYAGPHGKGTVVIDTNEKFLYLVLGNGRALRYGIGVARPGFEWAGTHKITRKAEWPGWTPPAAMRKREPHLPAYMPGGPENPLGARALYLGSTLYRIHGTAQPWTIGQNVSSGCIRLKNEDVIDLYGRVGVGTRVVVI